MLNFQEKVYFICIDSRANDPTLVSQIVCHGIFGTYLEYLKLLAEITTLKSWEERKYMIDAYLKMVVEAPPDRSETSTVEKQMETQEDTRTTFNLVPFTKISKLKSINLFKHVGEQIPQTFVNHVFSRRKAYEFKEKE